MYTVNHLLGVLNYLCSILFRCYFILRPFPMRFAKFGSIMGQLVSLGPVALCGIAL